MPRFVDDLVSFAGRARGSWQRRRGTTPPAPDRTGFYAADPVAPGRRGEVLAAEEISVGGWATGWRVRYRTVDAAGRPVATSMAVAIPVGLAPRPRPVVVWVHGAGGVATGCGPSRAGLDAWYAADFVSEGIVVAAPDLTGLGVEGPVHPYLHGATAGQAVLDAVRATVDLTTTGAGPRVAIAGHSAGGHAVLWANELATGEDGAGLDIRLAVPMSPVADLAVAMDHYATTRGMAAFPVQLAATWPSVEPVDLTEVLTPAAIARSSHLWTDRLGHLVRVFGGDPARWVRAEGFRGGEWAAALARQSAGRVAGAAPVVLVSGDADDAVPAAWTRQLEARLRQLEANVEALEYAGADHMGVYDAARADVVERVLASLG